jgi:hypothetical protein
VQKFTFEIPDAAQPYPDSEGGGMGPSAPLVPFVPEPLDPGELEGKTIDGWTQYAGTYGMGGPGFLGFCIGEAWLIVAIWGAADWFRLDGRLLGDFFWERHGRERPWTDDPEVDFKALFSGWRIRSVDVQRDSITLEFAGGRVLRLSPEAEDRPVHEGDGSPRAVEEDDDLRTHVFLAPTAELWI